MSHKKGLIQKYGVSCDARSDSSCTRPLYKQRKREHFINKDSVFSQNNTGLREYLTRQIKYCSFFMSINILINS